MYVSFGDFGRLYKKRILIFVLQFITAFLAVCGLISTIFVLGVIFTMLKSIKKNLLTTVIVTPREEMSVKKAAKQIRQYLMTLALSIIMSILAGLVSSFVFSPNNVIGAIHSAVFTLVGASNFPLITVLIGLAFDSIFLLQTKGPNARKSNIGAALKKKHSAKKQKSIATSDDISTETDTDLITSTSNS